MAQVCVAFSAQYFSAIQRLTYIISRSYVFVRDRRGEAWPTGSGVEFILRPKERRSTADAAVQASLFILPVSVREGELSSTTPCDRELFRREILAPLLVGLDELTNTENRLASSGTGEERKPDFRTGTILRSIGQLSLSRIPEGGQTGERNWSEQKSTARMLV
jgi:hypothetical protein